MPLVTVKAPFRVDSMKVTFIFREWSLMSLSLGRGRLGLAAALP